MRVAIDFRLYVVTLLVSSLKGSVAASSKPSIRYMRSGRGGLHSSSTSGLQVRNQIKTSFDIKDVKYTSNLRMLLKHKVKQMFKIRTG